MKSLLYMIALALLGLPVGETDVETVVGTETEENIESYFYHESVGIPLAAEIYEAESKAIEENVINSRIVGGTVTTLGAAPYVGGLLILLTSRKTSVCGSTLLSTTRSVTAAHCWYDGKNQGKEITLVFGSLKLYEGGVRISTTEVTMHENWNPTKISNDIAMIDHDEVTLTNAIKVMSLPTEDVTADTMVTITGFGRTSSDASGAITRDQVQRSVELTIAEASVCKRKFGSHFKDTNLCITGPKGKAKSTCQGDSGSGAIMKKDGIETLVGIASFGKNSCDKPNPIVKVFTKVFKYLDWIYGKMGK